MVAYLALYLKDIFRQRNFDMFYLTEKVSFFTSAFMVPANKVAYLAPYLKDIFHQRNFDIFYLTETVSSFTAKWIMSELCYRFCYQFR